jgi:uncharacterized membrane protein YccC
MKTPPLADLVFSLRTFAAAMLALYLAFCLDLPRPYWALTTTYIVARPLIGMTRSKALYRFFGTIIGASAAVGLVPVFVNAPELVNVALALWIAVCLYLSLLQPEPRNYAFRLSGYTAALVGFPCVNAPDQVFSTALARVEEISLGLVCACLVGDLLFPRRAGPALQARLDAWLGVGARWMSDALQGRDAGADRRRFALLAAALPALSVHAAYDSPEARAAQAATQALYSRGRMLLPVVSGLDDRLGGLGAQAGALAPVAGRFRKWLAAGPRGAPADAIPIREAIAAARKPGLSLLQLGALQRLDDLARLWQALLALSQCVRRGVSTPALRSVARGRRVYFDRRAAAISAVSHLVAIVACSSAFVAVGWVDGAIATMMGAMTCAVFATRDDPASAMMRFSLWITAGALAAGLWDLAVAPAIDGFPLLALSLGVVLVPAGLFAAARETIGNATAFVFGFGGLMAIQESYAADFVSWANGALTTVVGIGTAALVTSLIRVASLEGGVRRRLAQVRAEAARIASDRSAPTDLGDRMLDRIVAMVPRLTAPDAARGLTLDDALADLRVALDAARLNQTRSSLAPPSRKAVDLALLTLARRSARASSALPRRIDLALNRLAAGPQNEAQLTAAVALDGIRRALGRRAPLSAPPGAEPLEAAA